MLLKYAKIYVVFQKLTVRAYNVTIYSTRLKKHEDEHAYIYIHLHIIHYLHQMNI